MLLITISVEKGKEMRKVKDIILGVAFIYVLVFGTAEYDEPIKAVFCMSPVLFLFFFYRIICLFENKKIIKIKTYTDKRRKAKVS